MKEETLKKRLKGFPRVENMESSRGNDVPNQFIVKMDNATVFQSYGSIIAVKFYPAKGRPVTYLGEDWNYSTTTGKYRNQFLGETRKQTEEKIKLGIYKMLK